MKDNTMQKSATERRTGHTLAYWYRWRTGLSAAGGAIQVWYMLFCRDFFSLPLIARLLSLIPSAVWLAYGAMAMYTNWLKSEENGT